KLIYKKDLKPPPLSFVEVLLLARRRADLQLEKHYICECLNLFEHSCALLQVAPVHKEDKSGVLPETTLPIIYATKRALFINTTDQKPDELHLLC
ncbi:hypothetical protein, partial [Carboxylicivirga sp. RSCT41]|uniref:hypothetical protein n=1 Tax=Carboxylicivirga agarovorans TaxID=3417570 RepID=UPI003D3400CF